MNDLKRHDRRGLLQKRPAALVELILALSCVPTEINDLPNKEAHVVSKIIELIYGLRKSRIVLPVSFMENLNIYTQTRNKKLMAYSSKTAPRGSIIYIESWLSKQASEPIKLPDGMVRAIFDNEQKIGKTRKTGKEKKLPMSVITNSAMIELDPDNLVQNKAAFSPKLWSFLDLTVGEKMNATTSNNNLRDENYFRSRRNNLI